MAGARNVSAYAEMLADIEHVINLSPRMAIAYYNKGCILAEQGYIDGAIQAFGKAIELEPGWVSHFTIVAIFICR